MIKIDGKPNKDLDREVLLRMNDRDLLTNCQIDRYFNEEVCNDQFFQTRLLRNYPDTLRSKPADITYKAWYLKVIYSVAKLKEKFQYEYIGGNPMNQLKIISIGCRGKPCDWQTSVKSETTLYNSALHNEIILVKQLLDLGADIHSYDDGPIKIAISQNHLELVKYLIERGAPIDIPTKSGYFSVGLAEASYKGYLDIVKYLIEKGANIHIDNDHSIILASSQGHLEVVKYLVEHGANVHVDDERALKLASGNGHLEVVKYLVERGTNNLQSALLGASSSGNLDIVKYLIGLNKDVNIDKALWSASYNGRLETVKYLVEHGANIRANDFEVAKVAMRNKHMEVVDYFRSYLKKK